MKEGEKWGLKCKKLPCRTKIFGVCIPDKRSGNK